VVGIRALEPVSLKPQTPFGPVKPFQKLELCDYGADLFTYSEDELEVPFIQEVSGVYTSPF